MFAAVLGVIITAVITMILLKVKVMMTSNVREQQRYLRRSFVFIKTIFILYVT